MISKKDKTTLRRWIDEYCDHLPPKQKEIAFNSLIQQTGAYDIFCTCIEGNVARIGVKLLFRGGICGKTYVSTKYDSDLLDM